MKAVLLLLGLLTMTLSAFSQQGAPTCPFANGYRFVPEYDKEITDARKTFEHEDGDEFAVLGKYQLTMTAKYDTARAAALAVIFAYLYSGREEQAWRALDAMWPANDRARIETKILETRSMGILSPIGSSHGADSLRVGPDSK